MRLSTPPIQPPPSRSRDFRSNLRNAKYVEAPIINPPIPTNIVEPQEPQMLPKALEMIDSMNNALKLMENESHPKDVPPQKPIEVRKPKMTRKLLVKLLSEHFPGHKIDDNIRDEVIQGLKDVDAWSDDENDDQTKSKTRPATSSTDETFHRLHSRQRPSTSERVTMIRPPQIISNEKLDLIKRISLEQRLESHRKFVRKAIECILLLKKDANIQYDKEMNEKKKEITKYVKYYAHIIATRRIPQYLLKAQRRAVKKILDLEEHARQLEITKAKSQRLIVSFFRNCKTRMKLFYWKMLYDQEKSRQRIFEEVDHLQYRMRVAQRKLREDSLVQNWQERHEISRCHNEQPMIKLMEEALETPIVSYAIDLPLDLHALHPCSPTSAPCSARTMESAAATAASYYTSNLCDSFLSREECFYSPRSCLTSSLSSRPTTTTTASMVGKGRGSTSPTTSTPLPSTKATKKDKKDTSSKKGDQKDKSKGKSKNSQKKGKSKKKKSSQHHYSDIMMPTPPEMVDMIVDRYRQPHLQAFEKQLQERTEEIPHWTSLALPISEDQMAASPSSAPALSLYDGDHNLLTHSKYRSSSFALNGVLPHRSSEDLGKEKEIPSNPLAHLHPHPPPHHHLTANSYDPSSSSPSPISMVGITDTSTPVIRTTSSGDERHLMTALTPVTLDDHALVAVAAVAVAAAATAAESNGNNDQSTHILHSHSHATTTNTNTTNSPLVGHTTPQEHHSSAAGKSRAVLSSPPPPAPAPPPSTKPILSGPEKILYDILHCDPRVLTSIHQKNKEFLHLQSAAYKSLHQVHGYGYRHRYHCPETQEDEEQQQFLQSRATDPADHALLNFSFKKRDRLQILKRSNRTFSQEFEGGTGGGYL